MSPLRDERRSSISDGASESVGAVRAASALADRAGMMVRPRPRRKPATSSASNPSARVRSVFVERVAQDKIVLERYPNY